MGSFARSFAHQGFRRAAALAALGLACFAPASRGDGPTENEIRVEILGLRSDKGTVNCLLFNNAEGYPGDPTKAVQKMKSIIEHGRAACTFDEPRAGTYAISFIHDENENGKLDTNFLGIPQEGIGASNDAKSAFGSPKWEDAKFVHAPGLQALELHAHYF